MILPLARGDAEASVVIIDERSQEVCGEEGAVEWEGAVLNSLDDSVEHESVSGVPGIGQPFA
jgi:hypothetical protein